jgi:hypothetical protein
MRFQLVVAVIMVIVVIVSLVWGNRMSLSMWAFGVAHGWFALFVILRG